MTFAEAIPDHPIGRYQAIHAALHVHDSWQGPWLQFAVQAAVAAPGDPQAVAQAILRSAQTLRANTHWPDPLHAPIRYLVAAVLVQAGDSADAFAAELARSRMLFRQAGIVRGSLFEVVAILLLRLAVAGMPITADQVARLGAIYHQLKRSHWWITGPHDLPSCAMLATLQGSPEQICHLVEEYYRLLSEDGFSAGVQLEQAAHILPLLRLPPKQAVHRYGALRHRLILLESLTVRLDYEAIALLSFLDQDAETVAAACLAQYQDLQVRHPAFHHEIIIDLAADMTVLELMRQRMHQGNTGDDAGRRALMQRWQDEQRAAIIIACFGARSLDPASY